MFPNGLLFTREVYIAKGQNLLSSNNLGSLWKKESTDHFQIAG